MGISIDYTGLKYLAHSQTDINTNYVS
jgi:hypothetical protein